MTQNRQRIAPRADTTRSSASGSTPHESSGPVFQKDPVPGRYGPGGTRVGLSASRQACEEQHWSQHWSHELAGRDSVQMLLTVYSRILP